MPKKTSHRKPANRSENWKHFFALAQILVQEAVILGLGILIAVGVSYLLPPDGVAAGWARSMKVITYWGIFGLTAISMLGHLGIAFLRLVDKVDQELAQTRERWGRRRRKPSSVRSLRRLDQGDVG